MQTNLAIKNVEFNGATLRAAQDELGKIWVGVRWVCQGMGFDHERMKNERKKIQRDVVLNQGVKFYPWEMTVRIVMFFVSISTIFHFG